MIAHTKMAASMRAEGTSFGGNVALDLAVYDYARSVGNMEIMNLYADALYNSEKDYLDIEYKGGILVNPFQTAYCEYILKPIGGDLTNAQKTMGKLQNVFSALSGFAPNNISDIVSAMIAIANRSDEDLIKTGIEFLFTEGVKKILPALGVTAKDVATYGGYVGSLLLAFGYAVTDPVTGATNYTNDNTEFAVAVATEQRFLNGLIEEFNKKGTTYSIERNGEFISNMTVIVPFMDIYGEFTRFIENYKKT